MVPILPGLVSALIQDLSGPVMRCRPDIPGVKSSGCNVVPRRARPGLDDLRPHTREITVASADPACNSARRNELTCDCLHSRCRANLARIRQSTPYSGLGSQANILKSFKVFPLRSEAAGRGAGRQLRVEVNRVRQVHSLSKGRTKPCGTGVNVSSNHGIPYRGTSLIRTRLPP